ncbi:YciI family protein [Niveispirillum fermenti]|uniref:YciI family protein n=1 Tax=Niveispirillum fermenti TaxID=1233113 RepID=UPI003A846648
MSNIPPVVPRLESPTFLVLAYDIADTAQALKLRDDFMEGHLSHTEANWTRYVSAGPMRTDDGQGFVGSMFLVRAKDKADAEALMNGDPYFRSGLYGRVEIVPAVVAIGTAIGGRIWTDAARLKSVQPAGTASR